MSIDFPALYVFFAIPYCFIMSLAIPPSLLTVDEVREAFGPRAADQVFVFMLILFPLHFGGLVFFVKGAYLHYFS